MLGRVTVTRRCRATVRVGASQCAHGPGERMKISSAFGSSPNDAVAVVGETERSVPLFASGKDVVARPIFSVPWGLSQ